MSELDLFSVPPTQTSIENGTWVEYHPLTTVGDGSPIEYDISGTGEDYVDLANTMLYVQAKITKQDGTNLDANDPVGPVNLLLHSLFSQVDISLNGTQVTTSTNTYPTFSASEVTTLWRYTNLFIIIIIIIITEPCWRRYSATVGTLKSRS